MGQIDLQALKEGAAEMGVELDEYALRLFDLFTGELLAQNRVMNLTAITEPAQIATKHYLDSLSLLRLIRPGDSE